MHDLAARFCDGIVMTEQSACFQFDDVRVDVPDARAWKASRPVAIEPKAFRVLLYLIENRGRLVEKDELLSAVWPGTFVTETPWPEPSRICAKPWATARIPRATSRRLRPVATDSSLP